MLAITTSGASLSTYLPDSVSPSRLLQASTLLSAGDANYSAMPNQAVQVGPVFTLSIYMLFAAHALRPQHEEGIPETTWKEVARKARVKLQRVPLDRLYDFPSAKKAFCPHSTYSSQTFPVEHKAHEFAYQLMIIEDLDDDRFHEEQGESFEDVPQAGIREIIPIHEVSKIFYADTGKILKIGSEGESNSPILLIKRDTDAVPPRRMMTNLPENGDTADSGAHGSASTPSAYHSYSKPLEHERSHGFPRDLDPEWLALEVYTEAQESDSEEEEEEEAEITKDIGSSPPPASHSRSSGSLSNALSGLSLRNIPVVASPSHSPKLAEANLKSTQMAQMSQHEDIMPGLSLASGLPALRSSLSLLELLIRLTTLQQFQQASHLSINDEFLNFFLSGSSSTGAGADSEYRKRVRRDARLRIGFDPYDESPIKPRGEEYIQNNGYMHDGEEEYWQPWQDDPKTSPQPGASPSPSIRNHMKQRLGGVTVRTRSQKLRQELGVHARSSLGRSDSDSTLGTSPRTPALDETRKL
jgi:hypothetical protein